MFCDYDQILSRAKFIASNRNLHVPRLENKILSDRREFVTRFRTDTCKLTVGATYSCFINTPYFNIRELMFERNFFPWPVPEKTNLQIVENIFMYSPCNFFLFVDFTRPNLVFVSSTAFDRSKIFAAFRFEKTRITLYEFANVDEK